MNADTIHVSWSKIWTVIGVLLMPSLSIAYFSIVGGTKLFDKVDVVIAKQDKSDLRQDKFEEKLNFISNRVDTISHRQELNAVKQDYRFQLQQQQRPSVKVYTQR